MQLIALHLDAWYEFLKGCPTGRTLTIAPHIPLIPKIQHDVMQLQTWTAVAETGSCVHLTNAQLNKKKREGSKEGERRRAKGCLKYSTPLPLTSRVVMGTRPALYISEKEERWCAEGVHLFHLAPLKSSSAFSQWCHLFFTFSLTFAGSLSLSFLSFLSFARTCLHPPPCTHTTHGELQCTMHLDQHA